MISPAPHRESDGVRLPYIYDAWELMWDVISLATVHYSGDRKQFDTSVLRIAEEFRRCGDWQRAGWLEHMVKTQAPPSREWEITWFDAGEDLEGV